MALRSTPVTSAKVDSIKTGQEDTERWWGGAGGVMGIWESGVQAFHACTVTSGWEPCHHPGRVKAAFTKQGLRPSHRPPFVDFLCPPYTLAPASGSPSLNGWLQHTGNLQHKCMACILVEPRCPSLLEPFKASLSLGRFLSIA